MSAPLNVEFLANDDKAIAESIIAGLDKFSDAFFTVAYGTHGAFELLEKKTAISRYLKSGHRLRILFDADRHFTDPELIKEFATFPGDIECRLFAPRARNEQGVDSAPPFHAKVYYFEQAEKAAAIVGSSNFSLGGIRNNSEAAIHVCGNIEDEIFDNIRKFLKRMWCSPYQIEILENPGYLEEYEKAFKEAKHRASKLPLPHEAPVYQTAEDVTRLREAFVSSSQSLLAANVSYILGLVSAGWHSGDLRRRIFTIELRRGLLNKNNNHSGEIFFEGVSERGFDQRDCVRRDAERILSRLHRGFDALNCRDTVRFEKKADLSYRIKICFSQQSPIWKSVRPEIPSVTSKRRYFWPNYVDLEHETIRRSFLQGYMDLRTRIAATDALPQPYPLMRVAVSVGSHAPKDFSKKLRNLMAKEFGCKPDRINLLHGASRGRESIIRIDARLVPATFFESHWQRIIVQDFREFNDQLSE